MNILTNNSELMAWADEPAHQTDAAFVAALAALRTEADGYATAQGRQAAIDERFAAIDVDLVDAEGAGYTNLVTERSALQGERDSMPGQLAERNRRMIAAGLTWIDLAVQAVDTEAAALHAKHHEQHETSAAYTRQLRRNENMPWRQRLTDAELSDLHRKRSQLMTVQQPVIDREKALQQVRMALMSAQRAYRETREQLDGIRRIAA